MECTLQTGDRVICVKTPLSPTIWGCQGPIEGTVYTIRLVVPRKFLNGIGGVGVLLNEIVNPEWRTPEGIMEPAFLHTWFRRVVDTKKAVEDMAAIVRREFDHAPAPVVKEKL